MFSSGSIHCSSDQNDGKLGFFRLKMIFKLVTGVFSIWDFIWKLKFWPPQILTWNLWQSFFQKFFGRKNETNSIVNSMIEVQTLIKKWGYQEKKQKLYLNFSSEKALKKDSHKMSKYSFSDKFENRNCASIKL